MTRRLLSLVCACGGSSARLAEPISNTDPVAPSTERDPQDRDGDLIFDVDDPCPDHPEDFDGWDVSDGCPDADHDRDGVVDVKDRCQAEAETMNGTADTDGCPD